MNPIEMLKADVRKYEKQFLLKFKALPGLWDPAHAQYCNKYHRLDNLKKLLPILQKLKPNATVYDVKTKINTFRTNYRKEYNRIKNYIALNPDNKDFIKPKLWYFKYLMFLNTIKSKHNPNETNELLGIKFAYTSSECDENSDEKEPGSTPSTSSTSHTGQPYSSPTISTEQASESFKPEPVYVESDETEPQTDLSNVADEIELRTSDQTEVEDDEIEPIKDPAKIMECERNFLIMFRKLPGLWNPADPHYTNRYSRNAYLNKLLPFLQKINPKATVGDVRRKINTFRSNYRREMKKIEHNMSIAIDSNVVYKPKLWYYKYLSFLNELEDSKMREEQNEDEGSNDDVNFSELEVHSPTSFTVTLKPPKQKSSSEIANQTFQDNTEIATQFLTNQNEQIQNPIDYEWDETGENPKRKTVEENINESNAQFMVNQEQKPIQNPIVFEWDATLSRLAPKQRLFAKKAINDILYEAELGNLHKGSVKINQQSGQSSIRQFDQPSSSSYFDQTSHGGMRGEENVIVVKMEGNDPLSLSL